MKKRQPKINKPRLVDIAPVMRAVRDELDILSLRVLDYGKGEEDDRRQRRLDTQKTVDEGWSRVVGDSVHQASPGDVRSLLSSLSNILDLLRVLKVGVKS